MMLIDRLPGDIYQELQSWLGNDDQIAFAMANRKICSQLITRVRALWLQTCWPGMFKQRFRSYLTSEKLQSLIADPYHQLNLFFPEDLDLKVAGFDDMNISCRYLSITSDQLTTSFIHSVKKVQKLMLRFSGSTQHSLMDSQFQLMADWMSNTNLGLKELTIDNHNITNLPVISRLESLTITNCNLIALNQLGIAAYSHLRYLKLSSINSIEDVSSLDGIHELHLKNCHGIRDISCLNHNYKIVIEKCDNIKDYSNCFRHCKIIEIREPSNVAGESIDGFNLLKALEVREIYFDGGKCTKTLFLPQSLSLRSVILENLRSKPPFTLPTEHQIREITITNCEWVELNFDGISFVKLVDLKISTLEGLGNGNRVVEVNDCHLIKDFSVLKHCEKVIICECDGFRNINQVRGVKHLIFSPENVNKFRRTWKV